jgi:hypothetical protein
LRTWFQVKSVNGIVTNVRWIHGTSTKPPGSRTQIRVGSQGLWWTSHLPPRAVWAERRRRWSFSARSSKVRWSNLMPWSLMACHLTGRSST